MELELKDIVGYFPYGLEGISIYENLGKEKVKGYYLYGNKNTVSLITNVYDIDLEVFKPILRPLSDLTKEIEVNGEKFVPIELFEIAYDISKFKISNDIMYLPYGVVQKLYEWHFDLHSLIEKNLAIDINTLK